MPVSRILSVYTNAFGPFGVDAAADHCRSCGFDHLELALKPHDFGGLVIPESAVITPDTEEARVRSFRDTLAERGVTISGCNVGGGDLRTEDGVQITERRLRFATSWFAPNVAVSGAGQPSNLAERSAIVANLRRLGDLASSLGLTLSLETHKGPTQNARAMLDLMNDVDHPSVRLNFDTGNIAYYNEGLDPVSELRQVAGLVASVHLKDSRGRFEDWFFPALGDGIVDFVGIREALDAVGFSGPLTVEIEGIGGEPEPGLTARIDRVRGSADHLRRCGYLE